MKNHSNFDSFDCRLYDADDNLSKKELKKSQQASDVTILTLP